MYPVLDILSTLKTKLAETNVVILQAPPGAGKSTVLPLELMNESWLEGKKILMLEPRRLAAKSVAQRMASILQEDIGEKIGYRVRFESRVGKQTKVEVVTEGILTRMLQSDNSLEDAGLVIFDEFHERSLHADLALALCLQAQQLLRDDLRILIMSATLDGEHLSGLLRAPIVTSHGKQYPVTIKYLGDDVYIPVTVRIVKAIQKALREEEGDVLVFLPGAGEIVRVLHQLEEEGVNASLHPLYGDLPFQKQQEAILPHPQGRRKIVIATSIAETSLTIEGIRVVIDSGLSRVPKFDPRSGLTRLDTVRVTKDAADQRAGRAGRLAPGVCYRLWSESVQATLVSNRTPEILEADLAPLMLELGQWGVKDTRDLTWITVPPAGTVNQAKELLQQLEAIDNGMITSRGKEMLKLPTHPRIAHLLLAASGAQLTSLATDIAAILEERDPLAKESGADVALRVEALRKWRKGERFFADRAILERIERLAHNWRKILKVEKDDAIPKDTDVGRLLVAAYPERIAQQQGKHSERYKLANGRIVKLQEHDPLMRESWLCAAQLDAGSGEGKIFLAASLHVNDLTALAREQKVVRWDDERNIVVGVLEKRVGNLVLESKPLSAIPEDERVDVLCTMTRSKGLKAIGWGEAQQEWQARVNSIKQWRPEEAWPNVREEKLLETVAVWLAPFLTNITRLSELQRLDWNGILPSLLPWELSSILDTLAPVKIKVPSGSLIQVQYFEDGRAPIMEVRLQEMFGLLETPVINEGRTKVLLHLLSPGYKPVQVTQDLKSFWQTTYHEVRKQLRMRYPKHHWPEDPWTAEAVRGAKRRT
ncbi:ATP-dependent helicase HrpB [Ohtaekwangia koreensis]|uniref:ATP-dependent helicase HrpB n=1 Tax=Ohtaekwangia koreensis TaxID=688867 RepID=A0A1T5MDU1_9BACT|nr:ATP-dependent helicase HrpB [Ohtaekwangia koreensis]SKC86387.1 ATP-dependent helicase HrpB [Ohtaekwangia koreensis]